MASRKGSLLERNVEQLLKLSGFSPQLNKICNGYEIDVFLKYNNLKIAFECKQYERSTLAIRNLIHQWDSKNKELNFDKIILVLLGCDISNNDYSLAKKYGIIIWDENKLTDLLDKAIENKIANKETILKELKIKFNNLKDVKKEKIEYEKTKQQTIIKESLNHMLRKGLRGSGFVIFEEKETELFIQYLFQDEGFLLDFPEESSIFNKNYIKELKDLLIKMQFEMVKSTELNEKEFVYGDMSLFGDGELYSIWAQCGEDVDFVAYLTDKIFREIFKLSSDYLIDVQLELQG